MSVCCECCVLSGRGLCDRLITRPEESYRLWRVVVWSRNLENEEAKARYRALKIQPQWVVTPGKQTNKNKVNIMTHTSTDLVLWTVCSSPKRSSNSSSAAIEYDQNCAWEETWIRKSMRNAVRRKLMQLETLSMIPCKVNFRYAVSAVSKYFRNIFS
jgi:hypothetical protein